MDLTCSNDALLKRIAELEALVPREHDPNHNGKVKMSNYFEGNSPYSDNR